MNKVNKKWQIIIETPEQTIAKHQFFMDWAKLIQMQQNVHEGDLWTTIGDKRFLNLKHVIEQNPTDTTVTYTCDHWENIEL